VAFRKVHLVTEAHYLAQKIRPMAETLQYAGHLLTTGLGAPFVVNKGDLAGRVCVLNYFDFRLMIGHGPHQKSGNAKRLAYFRTPRLEHPAQVSVFPGHSLAIEVLQ